MQTKKKFQIPTWHLPKWNPYAKGFEIYTYEGYSIVKITNPWPEAKKTFSYVLKQKNTIIPDSLKHLPIIPIPIKNDCGNVHYSYSLVEMLASKTLWLAFPVQTMFRQRKPEKRIETGKEKLGKWKSKHRSFNRHEAWRDCRLWLSNNSNPSLDILHKSGLK
jgi:iron complex transport system substrate-binding protein